MNKKVKRILNVILSLLMIFAVVMLVRSIVSGNESQKDYDEANILAGAVEEETGEAPAKETAGPTEPEETAAKEPVPVPDDPVIHVLLEIDLEALRQENEDVVGWIMIPDTKVNYPLLQWTDNEFYLHHTWKQTPYANGSIFIECQAPDWTLRTKL